MHDYIITDRDTGEKTQLVAPNRNAALKAYVARRLVVERVRAQMSASAISAVNCENQQGGSTVPESTST
jgi:hypothetical protein